MAARLKQPSLRKNRGGSIAPEVEWQQSLRQQSMVGLVNSGNKGFVKRRPQQRSEIHPLRFIREGLTAHWLLPYAALFLIIALCLAADVILPRGSTVAIGYCLVPVLAKALRRRWSLLLLTAICTILTWVGYFLEPAGASWWASIFDRGMVTGVLWLTLLLVWRRMEAEIAAADKTEALRAAVRELHRSNAELEDFSFVVSHDIRGPLCAISLAANILSTRAAVKADPECKNWIDSIVAEISQVNDLIERLLSYARIGAGKVKLSKCNCEVVLSSVGQSLRAELEDADAELSHDPLPTVPADPVLMAQLLRNLIENSIKYRGSNPLRIHVSATPTAEGWLFAVRDNGIGINGEDCKRIFDRFYQSAAAGCSTGFGLGLTICKRIVDCYGGRIEVQSEPGHGSTFSFVIPDSHKRTDSTPESWTMQK